MMKKEDGKGDYWLWCAVDPDTKLVFSHRIGRRTKDTGEEFMYDVAKRVTGPVQIATDNFPQYAFHIRGAFGYEGYSYGTETKIFSEPGTWPQNATQEARKHGIPQIAKATRKAVIGSPRLGRLTTSHIERVFLSVRQESTRFTRQTLGYSKDLRMHKLATNLYFGIYNLVRKHSTLGTTPAVAAGIEEKRWTLEQVVEMTDAYWTPKYAEAARQAAVAKRIAEDQKFAKAMAEISNH